MVHFPNRENFGQCEFSFVQQKQQQELDTAPSLLQESYSPGGVLACACVRVACRVAKVRAGKSEKKAV